MHCIGKLLNPICDDPKGSTLTDFPDVQYIIMQLALTVALCIINY